MRLTATILAYAIGIVCALAAAFSGSVGPEPPSNPILIVYGYFYVPMLLLMGLPMGVIVGSLVAGLPFGGIAWCIVRLVQRRQK